MADVAPCGTLAAYRRHLRAGEKPCTACRQANRDVKRAQADQRRRIAPPAPQDVRSDFSPAPELLNDVPPAAAAGPVTAASDLRMVRDVLVAAIGTVKREDPTRLAPLVRELRETLRALDAHPDAAADAEDEFTVARRRRASLRPDA